MGAIAKIRLNKVRHVDQLGLCWCDDDNAAFLCVEVTRQFMQLPAKTPPCVEIVLYDKPQANAMTLHCGVYRSDYGWRVWNGDEQLSDKWRGQLTSAAASWLYGVVGRATVYAKLYYYE